jgi:ABC-type transport system substrate-binding protein
MTTISAESIHELKAAGVATEIALTGGQIMVFGLGGMFAKTDSRYKEGYHNQDPWTDVRVRQAMNISIDREAIAKAIYSGTATPAGSTFVYPGSEKYQYPYDPAKAKQLLIQAGYPNGFKFDIDTFTMPGTPELPRLGEAIGGYWLAIGLHPRIVPIDYNTYRTTHRNLAKTAGEIYGFKESAFPDVMSRFPINFVDGCTVPLYIDATTNAMSNAGNALIDPDARMAAADKLQKYLYDIYAPIPVVKVSPIYAWNGKKLSPFPYATSGIPLYVEYFRHATPLNTFRLFTVWGGR